MQIKLVMRQMVPQLKGALLGVGQDATEQAVAHTVEYLLKADKAFRGVGVQPLAIKEASMFEEAAEGSRASILRRLSSDKKHPGRLGILQRYGVETISDFEATLRRGLLAKKSWGDIRDDLVDVSPFLQKKPRFWAERIVRTEAMGAYNRAAWHANLDANEQLGDMTKILSGVFDDRTGADSYASHGQIRRPDEPFETWYGPMQHPPDRPNDRAVVVPHRISWPIPPYLQWKTEEEIMDAWVREGRKGKPPDRPLMTTVDLKLFGVQQPPKLREKEEAEKDESEE